MSRENPNLNSWNRRRSYNDESNNRKYSDHKEKDRKSSMNDRLNRSLVENNVRASKRSRSSFENEPATKRLHVSHEELHHHSSSDRNRLHEREYKNDEPISSSSHRSTPTNNSLIERLRINPSLNKSRSGGTHPKNIAAHRLNNLREYLEEIKTNQKITTLPPPTENKSSNQPLPPPFSNKFIDNNQRKLPPATVTSKSQFHFSDPIRLPDVNFMAKSNVREKFANERCGANDYKMFYNEDSEKAATSTNISFDASMDWAPIDEETIINNIKQIRQQIVNLDTALNAKNALFDCDITNHSSSTTTVLYIVVDTNIFLTYLSFLTTLTNTNFKGYGKATIVIPWMVLQELDYMKQNASGKSLRKSAQTAVQFINKQLSNKHPQYKGQSALDASKVRLSSSNSDDGILYCCMQLHESGKSTILLSNDINLRNKAMVNGIEAYNNSEMIDELNNKIDANYRSLKDIKRVLSNLLSGIIETELEDAYGEHWIRIVKRSPPFETDDALKIIDRFWKSIFSMKLQKQFKQKLDDFINFLKTIKRDKVTVDTFNHFVEYALSLCIYMKNAYPSLQCRICEYITNIQTCAE